MCIQALLNADARKMASQDPALTQKFVYHLTEAMCLLTVLNPDCSEIERITDECLSQYVAGPVEPPPGDSAMFRVPTNTKMTNQRKKCYRLSEPLSGDHLESTSKQVLPNKHFT